MEELDPGHSPEEGQDRTGLRDLARKPSFWLILFGVLFLGWLGSIEEGEAIFTVVAYATAGVLLYFLPAFIARQKPNANSIFVINLFLGWTLIGWVIALAMAVNNPTPRIVQPVHPGATATGRTCPFCAEQIQPAAILCKHCGRDLPNNTSDD